ncbi:MAG TPA: hypothetical protein VG245_05630, partial [Candidatus Dormibacteraeota bacterium]|nr:hypothetical protein [Candidatus Dormibacteraeota bacterium]
SSFSGCEEAPGTDTFAAGGPGNPQGVIIISNTNQDLYDATLKHAVAEGRTMFASTGDLGSSCPWLAPAALNGITNEAVPLLNYPADSAYAVGVGGTILYYDGDGKTTPATRALEYAWTYTGGGSSFFMKAGDYQSGVTTIVGHCVTDPHGNPYSPAAPLCRGIPDITAQSGDFQFGTGANPNGYTIASGGSPDQPGGGTSLSSPLWMGMWTRVQAASAGGTGFANPALYTIGKDSTKVANDFFDITQGSNGYYPAAPGWDYVSGWGAPMLTNIMKDVNGGNVTPIHNTPPPAVVTTVPTLPIHNNPCDHLFTGKAGNDSLNVPLVGGTPVEQGSNPQLNILAGDMTLSSDGLYLITTLTINNLTKALPPGGTANQYYMNWVFKGVTYYSVVEVSQTGVVTFGDGQITTGRATRSTTDGGQFIEGPNGKVIVDVPLSAVGNIVKGDQLSGPYGTTQEVEGVILPSYDQAGPNYDYQVGQVCTAGATTTAVSSPTPAAAAPSPTPTAAPLPNTALAAAGIWLPLGLLLLTLLGGVPLALLRRRGAG